MQDKNARNALLDKKQSECRLWLSFVAASHERSELLHMTEQVHM
jgi:hypothetical protein